LAVVVTVSANGTLKNKDGNLAPQGSYVQVIQSSDASPGLPNATTGLPQGDSVILTGEVNPAGTYNSGISVGNNNYVYLRIWDSWKGTGTPTGYYGTTTPESVGSKFVYTYSTSLNASQWNQFGSVTISNISIVRQGSNVVLSWTTTPTGAPVDIWTKTGYFSKNAVDWPTTAEFISNTSGSLTQSGVVGNGTNKYYKLVPAGTAKAAVDFTTGVYGKFDLSVGPSDTDKDEFFISLPLELTDPSIAGIFSNQVNNMDMVVTFDIDKNVTSGTMYSNNSWEVFPGVPLLTQLDAGYAYGYITSVLKKITITGKVKENNFSRTLHGNPTLEAQWIANPYPTQVTIANGGLNASSYNANPTVAATVYYFDANAELIGGTNGLAFHTAAAEWKEGTLAGPSPIVLEPGRGYMFTEPVQPSFNWNMTRP